MVEDNTPTVTARKRKPTPRIRLRLDTVSRLKKLSAKSKRCASDKLPGKIDGGGEAEQGQTFTHSAAAASRPPPGQITTREPVIKKNTLQKPQRPKAKFRKRQIHKAWLPTHVFHAKRAHMTPPKEPLWRMAIPLSPTAKSYRPAHRATRIRGGMAWDKSYMSTIGLNGNEDKIIIAFKALGVDLVEDLKLSSRESTRWRAGTRAWEGWLHHPATKQAMAPVTIVWCAKQAQPDVHPLAGNATKRNTKRTAFIRVHPAGFLQIWEQLIEFVKEWRSDFSIEDLRFEIGSIEVSGPAATEALIGTIRPSFSTNSSKSAGSPEDIWRRLAELTNVASLPENVVLGFGASDSRLHLATKSRTPKDHGGSEDLLHVLVNWPPDKTQDSPAIFSNDARLAAARRMPSQKAINRRKAIKMPRDSCAAQPGDPEIPVLLITSKRMPHQLGSWTVLMPWKCVLPQWHSLMHYPLSSGGTLRFGGLDQTRQVAFEAGSPWFPADYPGTAAGMAWEEREQEVRRLTWERRPKGKRTEYNSVDLGRGRKGEIGHGWACDWQRLVGIAADDSGTNLPRQMYQRTKFEAPSTNQKGTHGEANAAEICTVRFTLLSRGVPKTCARIYRLPATKEWRSQWLSLLSTSTGKTTQREPPAGNMPAHLHRRMIAETLLIGPSKCQVGEATYPDVPSEEDLVGFVTSGNFSLSHGKGIGIGALLWEKVANRATERQGRLCIVRNAGEVIGRLATWEPV